MTENVHRPTAEGGMASQDGPPKSRPIDFIRENVHKLALARRIREHLKVELTARQKAFEEANRQLRADYDVALEAVNTLELTVRGQAQEAYLQLGALDTPGLAIRRVRTVSYNPADAFKWAKDQGVALQLDKNAFEKLVLSGAMEVPVAQIHQGVQATIASDLDAALRGEG